MPDDPAFTMEDVRPRLLVRDDDLPRTARDLAALMAATGRYYSRSGPVTVIRDPQGGYEVRRMTRETVVHAAHDLVQPFALRGPNGTKEVPITLPDRVALLYLDRAEEWGLPPLRGIAYAPLLDEKGAIHAVEGYHAPSGQFCAALPKLMRKVPAAPTRTQAKAALLLLRQAFATLPFADATRTTDAAGQEMVDITVAPGADESAFLNALLTAVCRPSLELAPGLLVAAPQYSGSGTGKGLLARAICYIAYGRLPDAVTGGADRNEMDKRLAAALLDARPAILFDNLNGVTLASDQLASVLTENPASVRILGHSQLMRLSSTTFIAVTGNGIQLAEDLVRRFLTVTLDARTEDPEQRNFTRDLMEDIGPRRAELLAACLTILRWGRRAKAALPAGKPLGSYRTWARWVRDPLLALGCCDPVQRVRDAKTVDPERQELAELLSVWHQHHGAKPMPGGDLCPEVMRLVDPQGRGRQFVTAQLQKFNGARAGGFLLTVCKGSGRWSTATYRVEPTTLPLGLG